MSLKLGFTRSWWKWCYCRRIVITANRSYSACIYIYTDRALSHTHTYRTRTSLLLPKTLHVQRGWRRERVTARSGNTTLSSGCTSTWGHFWCEDLVSWHHEVGASQPRTAFSRGTLTLALLRSASSWRTIPGTATLLGLSSFDEGLTFRPFKPQHPIDNVPAHVHFISHELLFLWTPPCWLSAARCTTSISFMTLCWRKEPTQ